MAGSMRRGLVATVAAAAATMMGTAGPATAAVVESDHYVDAGVETLADFCDSDIDFRHAYRYRGHVLVTTHGPGTAPYFADRFHGYDTFTNLDTDKTFTVVNNGQFRDQKITVNSDGTLTIIQQYAGLQIVRADSGRIIFKDRGTIRWEIIVDYNGTLTNPDDDTIVEDNGEVHRAGKFDTLNRDFCADLLKYTA